MKDFELVANDWSSYNRAKQDEKKHQDLIEAAVKANLSELLGEESVIQDSKNGKVKLPIKSLKQPKIRFGDNNGSGMGSGNGDSPEKGDQVDGKGGTQGAGDSPGEDWIEVDVQLEEIEDALFEDLELPVLKNTKNGEMVKPTYEYDQIHHIGILGNLDKKRSFKQALKRTSLVGKPSMKALTKEDLRFKTWREDPKPSTDAVFIAMMDTSGSMGIWEKYMARSFFFWVSRFLNKKYEKVQIVFISHHTDAKEVDEYTFFHKGESGGTICSSAYRTALEIIDERFSSNPNIYCFHFSDGDNLTSDNDKCVRLIKELEQKCVKVGYLEVNQYNRHSTLMSAYKLISSDILERFVLKSKDDILFAMKHFFGKEKKNDQFG